jgi:hypothetical protein
LIDADVRRRNLEALELAFSNRDYPLVRSLAREIGGNWLGFKSRLKVILASLPEFIRTPFVALALRLNPSSVPQGSDK